MIMWDSLFSKADFSDARLLPRGVLWALDSLESNRSSLSIVFKEHGQNRQIRLDVEPTYFSMSDEWVEAYGGMESSESIKILKSGLNLRDLKDTIDGVSPGYSEGFRDLELYFISAMEWNIRIASLEQPKITEIDNVR